MTRPAEAIIDLNALRANARLSRTRHGGMQLCVLKANAYGHGAVKCAEALSEECDGFAVAFLDEAISLRDAGVTGPILVLEGAFDSQELELAVEHRLWVVVHQMEQLHMVERAHVPAESLVVWLKIDTGMHRAGLGPEQVREAHKRLLASGKVREVVLMSHLARADEPDAAFTLEQVRAFDASTEGLAGSRSLCNSAGILGWTMAHRDWARPGILLYGADPMPAADNDLQPVMTLRSKVFAVRWLAAGEVLGYGGSFVAEEPTRVGLVAIGYADGYPRAAPTGTPVAVDGQLSRLIGRVSMDMLTVDLTHVPGADVGSSVELWGRQVSVNEVARRAGTISYELLCNVKRVPLRYV